MNRQAQTLEVIKILSAAYPDAHTELDFRSPLELLVATILSAQCTDRRVNMVTPALFKRCARAGDYAEIPSPELEELIRSAGFYRSKARNLKAMGAALVAEHNGKVPADMAALCKLPGVGRKTANVVLGNAFQINEGVVVDTHVARVSQRLGITRHSDPLKIEADLMKLVPRDDWAMFSHWLIFHGRRRCYARNPECPECECLTICPTGRKLIKKPKHSEIR